MSRRRWPWVAGAALLLAGLAVAAYPYVLRPSGAPEAAVPGYRVVAEVPLTGGTGRFDYQSLDAERHRDNPQLKAFVQGATAAATGAIAGAVVVLALRAIVDLPTALVALISLGVLLRWKLQEPVLVAAAGAAGLVLWPLLHAAG